MISAQLNKITRHFSKDDASLSSVVEEVAAPMSFPEEDVGEGGKLSGISRFCLFSFLRWERLRYLPKIKCKHLR